MQVNMRLFLYIENYMGGGAPKYFIDFVSAIPPEHDVIIGYNAEALTKQNIKNIQAQRQCTFRKISIRSKHKLLKRFSVRFSEKKWLKRLLFIILEPCFYLINLIIFLKVIGKSKADICISFNGGYPAALSTIAAVWASKLLGKATMHSIVSTPRIPRGFFKMFSRVFDRITWKNTDRIIVNSKKISEELSKHRRLSEEKIRVLYNYCSFCEVKHEKIANYQSNTTIGVVARIDRLKGTRNLLEAFFVIHEKYPETKLILAGIGDDFEYIKGRVEASAMNEHIEILGYYDGDIPELIYSIDIYVFPSLQEGLPYSILEAMHCERPIVATNVGGIPELILNDETGLLVEPNDIDQLVVSIEKLILDEALRNQLGRNAKSYLSHFSKHEFEANVVKLFDQ